MYKFIFIDDEDLMRDFFAEVMDFKAYGFTLVKMFSTAEQALEYLKNTADISVVITDIKMGNLSGIDFCEKVREYNQEILLVVLSGYKDFEFAQRAIKCNVFDYVLKPTMYEDIEMLFTRLKKQLDSRQKKAADASNLQVSMHTEDYHYKSIISMILNYIEENFNTDISLDSVAFYVSMNPAYLSRFFKQHTKCNFIDYLSKIRVEKAIGFLQDPTVKIGEICEMVGYKAPQHFYKVFKQYAGCTPSEFRANMLRPQPEEDILRPDGGYDILEDR